MFNHRLSLFSIISLLTGILYFPVAVAQESVKLESPSTLRLALGADTLAYLRLPLLSAYMGENNRYFQGDSYSDARDEIVRIRAELTSTVISILPPESAPIFGPVITLFVENMATPLELAIVTGSNPNSPAPQLLLSTEFNISPDELNNKLTALAQDNPMLVFPVTIDAQGNGSLLMAGIPLHFQYIDHKFSGLLSPSATPQLLQSAFTANSSTTHPMTASELATDSSGQGMFFWINAQNIISLANTMGAAEPIAQLNEVGLGSLQEFSLGLGRVENQGRLSFAGTFSEANPLLPAINNEFDFTTRGEPHFMVSASLPDVKTVNIWIDTFEAAAQTEGSSESKIREAEAELGFKISDFVKSLGPEVVAFEDDTGSYTAIKIRNRTALYVLLDKLKEHDVVEYSTHNVKGVIYHHLILGSLYDFAEDEMEVTDERQRLLMQSMFGKSHIFWIEEDDYLITAKIPQVLMGRIASSDSVSVKNWLTESLGQDFSQSLFSFAGDVEQLPSKSYYFYLTSLLTIADIVGTKLDIFSFPTTQDLDLKNNSSIGIQMDVNPQSFRVQFNYENSPLDFAMQGNGMTQVAIVGILAAIALPAYQEYTIRAKLSEAMIQIDVLSRQVADYYIANGTFPNEEESLNYTAELIGEYYQIYLAPNTGVISIEYSGNSQIEGEKVQLFAVVNDQAVSWKCEATEGLKEHYLPLLCK